MIEQVTCKWVGPPGINAQVGSVEYGKQLTLDKDTFDTLKGLNLVKEHTSTKPTAANSSAIDIPKTVTGKDDKET